MIHIAILGSTGSIGKTTLNIIKKDKKNFNIKLLFKYKNIEKVFKQAKYFGVKNVIIAKKKVNPFWKKKFKKIK